MIPAGKLIDRLNELSRTSAERKIEREAARAKALAEFATTQYARGVEYAKEMFPHIDMAIINSAEEDAETYQVCVQYRSPDYSLDGYDSGYAETIAQHYRDEGLDVEWKLEVIEPSAGGYNSVSAPRYSRNLVLSW